MHACLPCYAAGREKTKFGPWISNGPLYRGVKAEGIVVQRANLFRKVG